MQRQPRYLRAAFSAAAILSVMLGNAAVTPVGAVTSSRGHCHKHHHTGKHSHKIRAAQMASAPIIYYGHTRHAGLLRAPQFPAITNSTAGGDYLSCTEGVCRWPTGHTIRVYVSPGRPSFPHIVESCFNEWTKAAGGNIHFRLVPSAAQADYIISWTGRQKEVSEGTEAGLTTTDTFVDDDGREYIDRAHTSVLTRYDGAPLSDREVAETCLHEIGHGLGIEGHSSNPRDIMYYAVSSKQTGHLTQRDANTIAHLYVR